jgi:hypothetical protein
LQGGGRKSLGAFSADLLKDLKEARREEEDGFPALPPEKSPDSLSLGRR